MSFLNPAKIIHSAAIPAGGVVADFGFGSGNFLELLAKEAGKEGKVYAIDIQKNLVEKISADFAEKNITNAEFLNVDLEEENSTKIAENSVDFVLISAVLFQSNFKEKILAEAVRITKTGGRILLIDWKESFSGIGPEKEQIFTEDQALMMFKNFPVDLDRRIESGIYHYALIYKKN